MSSIGSPRHALIFGGSGLVGRHLILALHEAGVRMTTASRSSASAADLGNWLRKHRVSKPPPDVRVDFTGPDLLPGGESGYDDVTEIYNCAGSYRFGMTVAEARQANVGSVEAIVDLAARLPRLRRLIHVSGYRVGGQGPSAVPWSEDRIRRTYRDLGAYEASKVESDAVLRARARERGVRWSIVNPSTVIGDSRTGESDQQVGLAASLKDLWQVRMPALPGNSNTFVPVVSADYLAKFMVLLPIDDETADTSYWVLDDRTPPLPELLTLIGVHYGVRVPRARIPVAAIRHLPRRITRADPEALSFLSPDRYPIGSAVAFARRHGISMPEPENAILAWADYLAAHRFGGAPDPERNRRFTKLGGLRTFVLGDDRARRVVLPGLPVNADTWEPVVNRVSDIRAVDLPGLGMSAGRGHQDWTRWLAALTAESEEAQLVGHSIGAAAALAAANEWPERVRQLTLVSPFFLQPAGGLLSRLSPLTSAYLRRVRPAGLAQRLTGDLSHAPALESSVSDLRRRGTASRVARLLAAASRAGWRRSLREMLVRYRGPLQVVVGERDPLTPEAQALVHSLPQCTLTIIPGAGHHPQLTHPAELARVIAAPSVVEAG